MTLTSVLFLFLFLPPALGLYYISGSRIRKYVLLVFNLLFYALGSVEYIILFAVVVFVTVAFGRMIRRSDSAAFRKCLLLSGICINAGLLAYYKYGDFLLGTWAGIFSADVKQLGLALPLGISFFTFKSISYLVDVYKGGAALPENPVHDALYLSFFPQVQAGPLSRYSDFSQGSRISWPAFSDGMYRFLVGYCKKILIADILANVTAEIFAAPSGAVSSGYLWLGSLCYSLQLLFDFSGYSDMAIGISGMFGYCCKENFDHPYMTVSVTRFWRRWHISLGQWFRDYVYIPMGGSRTRTKARACFNLFTVWALTGIWHGASWNFLVWGLGYFVVIAFERFTNLPGRIRHRWGKAVYRILTLLFIHFQWVLFNARDLSSGLKYIGGMIAFRPDALTDFRASFLLKEYWLFIAAGVVLCFPVVPWIEKKLSGRKTALAVFRTASALAVLCAFVCAVSFVVTGMNNPFAYAGF